MDASEGIPLSLGELTGGGMFVQSVVVGRIIFLGSSLATRNANAAGGKVLGVTCREELIRDVTMYGVSSTYVFWMCSRGVIFYRHVVAMLALYSGYVALVFAYEIRRYYSDIPVEVHDEKDRESGGELYDSEDEMSLLVSPTHATTQSFDEEDQSVELSRRHRGVSLEEHVRHHRKADPPGMKQSARVLRIMEKQRIRQRQRLLEKRKSIIIDTKQVPQDRSSLSKPSKDQPWSLQLFSDSLRDLCQHFDTTLRTNIWSNAELSRFEWFCQLLESPFIIIRGLVIPVPCEADYNRSLVAHSIAFSPLWVCFYLTTKIDDFDPFCGGENSSCTPQPSLVLSCCISLAVGCIVIKHAPKEEGASMPLHYSIPIAIYGFLIAATWIDVISDQLVNTLEFVGLVLRVPASIMGMTVLAWGNSVGDYTTNGALAQRGLSEMSMAAW